MTRVAIAHDYLTQRGGAERVLLSISKTFPDAPIFTSVYNPKSTFQEFRELQVIPSPLQRWRQARRNPRIALPLLARTWSNMRVTGFDVVVMSSSGWAHGLGNSGTARRVVYCHNPARWLYQPDEYLRTHLERASLHFLRRGLLAWDLRAAQRANIYLANSSTVADRINRAYSIRPKILFPPAHPLVGGLETPHPQLTPRSFYLAVARGRSYKRVENVMEAIESIPGSLLAVVGSPPPRSVNRFTHTHWLGIVSDAQLRWLYSNASALITVASEDFGLTPIEANTFGTPVIALRAGGFLDTVCEGVNGVFVDDPSPQELTKAILSIPAFSEQGVRAHAEVFSEENFCRQLREHVLECLPSPNSLGPGTSTTSLTSA